MAHRRGVAAVAMVVVLITVDLIVIAIVLSGSRDHDMTVRGMETIEAYYAAEAGMHMGIREMMEPADDDGDTVIGSISSETPVQNNANDVQIGDARVYVVKDTGPPEKLTSKGRSGDARREMDAEST
ncbi:MAG: hypothetical protein ACYSTY_04710 [Planctomycetota bacterium]|jgi:hypothetical protein